MKTLQTETETLQGENELPPAGAEVFRTESALARAGSAPAWAESALARAERHPALLGLVHFAQPLEGTLSGISPGAAKESGRSGGGPAMIFRSPAPAAPQMAAAQEQEGEAVLAAQTVSQGQARAMNRAFSYSAPPGTGGGVEPEPGALPEQRLQTAGPAAQEVNYNRLTEEILVRIERRLRAERRKFGL